MSVPFYWKNFEAEYVLILTMSGENDIMYLENNLNSRGGIINAQNIFKALSDSVRREILLMLKWGSKSAGNIAAQFNMTQATVSYHLAQLKAADLITETKVKNFIYYELNRYIFFEIVDWLLQFDGMERDN